MMYYNSKTNHKRDGRVFARLVPGELIMIYNENGMLHLRSETNDGRTITIGLNYAEEQLLRKFLEYHKYKPE